MDRRGDPSAAGDQPRGGGRAHVHHRRRAEQAADVAQSESASQKRRVYQMLNPFDQVDMQIDDLAENPLDPFLLPAVLLLLVLGGLERFLNYRMQMIPFAKASAA